MASSADQRDSLRLIAAISELEAAGGGLAAIRDVREVVGQLGQTQRFNELMEGLQNNRIIMMKICNDRSGSEASGGISFYDRVRKGPSVYCFVALL